MRNLESLQRTARTSIGSTSFDLRTASARLAPDSPMAGLQLAQLAAGVNAASAHLPREPAAAQPPMTADAWVVAAGNLHEAVSRAFDAILGLWEAAEQSRTIITVPEGAKLEDDDVDLFGFRPEGVAFDGWTSPLDGAALDALTLPVGSPAWRRRDIINAAATRWCSDHQSVSREGPGYSRIHRRLRECDGALPREAAPHVVVDIRQEAAKGGSGRKRVPDSAGPAPRQDRLPRQGVGSTGKVTLKQF